MTDKAHLTPAAGYDGSFSASATSLATKIETREPIAGILGLGYVNLLLALEVGDVGYTTFGFGSSGAVVHRRNAGDSHIQEISSTRFAAAQELERRSTTTLLRLSATSNVVAIDRVARS